MSLVDERYEKWVNHPNLDARYKDDLANMSADEKNDAFYTLIEFGTAGMRGILGPGTNRINIHTIRKATQGYSDFIIHFPVLEYACYTTSFMLGKKPVKKELLLVMTIVICLRN